MKIIKCQCPEKGFVPAISAYEYREEEKKAMNHEPNKCIGDYKIYPYLRDGKKLYLCSVCFFSSDIDLQAYVCTQCGSDYDLTVAFTKDGICDECTRKNHKKAVK